MNVVLTHIAKSTQTENKGNPTHTRLRSRVQIPAD